MAERTTKVTLSAQVQQYVAGMQQAAQSTRETGSEAEKLAQKTDAFEKMGRASMVAGGAMAAGLGLSAKAAIDWDSAWAGVTKTVDGTPEQLAAVEEGLRGLTGVLPASHEEIAAVAEAAGQLGIQTPQVVEFTRTMIDMGETTNLSSEEAATSLARFMTVMGTSQDDVSRLGSALVELGNNYATTEAEIMAMSMRLAGAGAQIGMSEGQVLGLSTALSSVGIEAEAGGSAMSKVMIDIASSVDKGGERLEQFAQVAGMSAETFAAKWKKDPGEALAAFVQGLANAEAQGKSTFGILEELGITEVRMRDALLRSASAADQFSEAMSTGNKAFGENSALADEAAKRYETTAAQLGIMRNKVVDAAISLGEHLLPLIDNAAEGIGNFADALSGLDGPMGAVVAWGGLIASGILLTGGVALAAVPKIAAYKVALETLGVSTSALGGKLRGIGTFLTGPWGIALGLAATTVGVFSSVMDESKVSAQEMEIALKQGKNAFEAMQEEANKGLNVKGVYDMTASVQNLGAVLEESAGYANSFTKFMLQDFDDKAAIENVNELGRSLAQLAATDMSDATSQFEAFGEAADLNRDQLALALDEMPEFKSALLDVANASGLATDDATLLQLALGEIEPAAEDGAAGAEKQSESLEELAGVAQQTGEEIADLADQIRDFGAGAFDVEGSAIKLQEEYRKLADALIEGGQSLDITTESGGETVKTLMDIASAANASAGATMEMTGNQEAANAILEEARQRIIDARVALGEDPEAAAQWADRFVSSSAAVEEALAQVAASANAIPPEKMIEISADAASAFEGIEGVNVAQIDDKTAVVFGDNADAQAKIDDVISKGIPGKTATINGDNANFWAAWAEIQNTPLTKHVSIVANVMRTVTETFSKLGENANGGIYAYANGGISEYADGGFASGIYKGGTPIHKFAEPETLWEAYISGKPSERDRNRQIWAETGNRLGMSAGQTVVHVPVELAVRDLDGAFIGRMKVEATRAVDVLVEETAAEQRRAGL